MAERKIAVWIVRDLFDRFLADGVTDIEGFKAALAEASAIDEALEEVAAGG